MRTLDLYANLIGAHWMLASSSGVAGSRCSPFITIFVCALVSTASPVAYYATEIAYMATGRNSHCQSYETGLELGKERSLLDGKRWHNEEI